MIRLFIALLVFPCVLPLFAAKPNAPRAIDDEELFSDFHKKLVESTKSEKSLKAAAIQKAIATDGRCKLVLPKPAAGKLEPEEIYEKALASVFLLGSVQKDEEGEYRSGRLATAWVLTADGVMVTNRHVFENPAKTELFAVMDHKGTVYPVTEILASDRAGDLTIFRVDAKDLIPLAIAERPAPVGSWIGILGHPGDRYFTYSQGSVTRYCRSKGQEGEQEEWLATSAEFAYGASGSPLLDRHGAVVGIAAMTESVDYPEEATPPEEKTKKVDAVRKTRKPLEVKPKAEEKPKNPEEEVLPVGSRLQMVVKLASPVARLRAMVE